PYSRLSQVQIGRNKRHRIYALHHLVAGTMQSEKGERDRLGRSVRRLAEQLGRQIPIAVWCASASAANSSAGRRRERSRRSRSPSSTASFRLNRNNQRPVGFR